MQRLTYKNPDGTFGLNNGYDMQKVPTELYGAIWKLKDYEETGLDPETLKEIDKLYLEKCEEVNRIKAELERLKEHGHSGLLFRLPCKVGDTVYVDSSSLPIEDMEEFENEDKMPQYFKGRIVSFRIAKRKWIKIAVRAKWLYEWVDNETGPESGYIDMEKNFVFPLYAIGKTIFLTQEEAERALKEME